MVLVHDMGESLTGDIIPSDGVPKGPNPVLGSFSSLANSEADKKYEKETLAIKYLSILVEPTNPDFAAEIPSLFEEFEKGNTLEARLARDLDLYERALQAFEYEKRLRGTKRLDDMVDDLDELVTPQIKDWAVKLTEEREAFWSRKIAGVVPIYVIGISSN
jgi:putative hydrolase of HD superfamily